MDRDTYPVVSGKKEGYIETGELKPFPREVLKIELPGDTSCIYILGREGEGAYASYRHFILGLADPENDERYTIKLDTSEPEKLLYELGFTSWICPHISGKVKSFQQTNNFDVFEGNYRK